MNASRSWTARAVGTLIAVLLATLPGAGARAHEFWIEAEPYVAEPGGRVDAHLKIGQRLSGQSLPFISVRRVAFTVTTPAGTWDVASDEGDLPALSYTASPPGLHVIAYQSSGDLLTYDSWEKFTSFLEYEGLDGIEARHRARRLPESGFREAYVRYAKSLVQVGPAGPGDRDRALGLQLELVAESNPYAAGARLLDVALYWHGEPLPDTQVSVFRRDDPVARTLHETDGRGRVRVPVGEPGEYLLNAVHMEPVAHRKTAWRSHWASLTFRIAP